LLRVAAKKTANTRPVAEAIKWLQDIKGGIGRRQIANAVIAPASSPASGRGGCIPSEVLSGSSVFMTEARKKGSTGSNRLTGCERD
jgi:hypothetical protein